MQKILQELKNKNCETLILLRSGDKFIGTISSVQGNVVVVKVSSFLFADGRNSHIRLDEQRISINMISSVGEVKSFNKDFPDCETCEDRRFRREYLART